MNSVKKSVALLEYGHIYSWRIWGGPVAGTFITPYPCVCSLSELYWKRSVAGEWDRQDAMATPSVNGSNIYPPFTHPQSASPSHSHVRAHFSIPTEPLFSTFTEHFFQGSNRPPSFLCAFCKKKVCVYVEGERAASLLCQHSGLHKYFNIIIPSSIYHTNTYLYVYANYSCGYNFDGI